MNKKNPATERGKVTPVDAGRLRKLGPPPKDRPIARIHLLGPMRATTCLGDDILPHGKKPRAVLGYLCLAAGEPVSRARLAALLWDRMPKAAARNNLRQALRELSLAFGVFAKELIFTGRDIIRLNVDGCWVDVLAAMALDPSARDWPYGDLNALCRGELLEGLDGASASFGQWLRGERTRVTERLQSLLESELMQAGPRRSVSRGRRLARADAPERAKALQDRAQRSEALRRTADVQRPPEKRIDYRDSHLLVGAMARKQRSPQPRASGRNRLRVGVLPLVANSSESEEDLAVSLSQQVTAALARFRWFDVIAAISPKSIPSSCFVSEQQIRRMNLDYLVDWTVSGHGRDAQIDIRLLKLAGHAQPVWSERFDLGRCELHRLNELVTSRIVSCIDPIIPFIEGWPKRQGHYSATGILLLAMPLMFSMERGKYEQAGRLIRLALDIDPDNSAAAAWAAYWHHFHVGQGWTQHTEQAFATVQKYALQAMKLDPDNAEALGIYAHYCSLADRDFETALCCFDRSLRLNPSLAFVWGLSGPTYCYIGQPEVALERLDHYRDLAPFDPNISWFEALYTIAYTVKGDYERAVTAGQRAVKALPDFVNFYKPLIASLGHLERRDEAKPHIAKLLALEPNFTVERFGQVYPFKKDSDRKRYMQGLRLAGVPVG
jgi:DNA-binding SARP family transcriptional activator/TolB-like protein